MSESFWAWAILASGLVVTLTFWAWVNVKTIEKIDAWKRRRGCRL